MNSEKLIDYGKRWALLALGMFVAASGISLITQTHLGTTPISSLPYTITGLTGLTFGTTTFIVNVVFFVIEWLLLKKRGVFHAFMCFQVPVVFVFSAFIDFTMTPAAAVMPSGYIPRFIVSFLGNAILALGIVMQIHSRTIVQPGEGIVLAESVFFRHPFGTMKVVNDWSLVIIACIVALIFTGGIIGVREGTFVSALCVGLYAKQFMKLWPMPKAPEPRVAEEKAMA